MEHIPGYDRWKLQEPDEPEAVKHCDCCGKEIYEGDYYYEISGEVLCTECVIDSYRRRA